MSEKPSSGSQARVTPWRRRLFVLTSVLVTLSVVARVAMADEPAESQGAPPAAHSLVDGQPPPPEAEAEQSGWARLLPFVTEGGIALLIGLALGAATRTLLRTILMMIILVFVVVQVLAYKSILTVDWGTAAHAVKDFVLNVSPDGGFGSMIQQKIPTFAAFLLGYYLGLKK